jgi:hypothetical protein
MRWLLIGIAVLVACQRGDELALPIELPPDAFAATVVDRRSHICSTPTRLHPTPFDSTLADTLVVMDAPNDTDAAARIFGLQRATWGTGYWYDSSFHNDPSDPNTATDSLRVGVWRVWFGSYHTQIWPDDIEMQYDEETGRGSPESWDQKWFLGFAPISERCAVILAWRSLPLGSYRTYPKDRPDVTEDALRTFFERIRVTGSASP